MKILLNPNIFKIEKKNIMINLSVGVCGSRTKFQRERIKKRLFF
jgi:hypothetical protein